MNNIESERLIFNLYKQQDRESLINLLTDKKVMKHVDTGPLEPEQAEALWIKLTESFYPQGIATIWAVFCKDDSRYIGHAAIRPRPGKKEDWEISYMLKTDEWGSGFATEIARRLIGYGFDELKLSEVFATIDEANTASIRVAEKAGMSFLDYEFDEQGRFAVYSIKNDKK